MPTTCRACHSVDLSPIPFDIPASAGVWLRCAACGSDTATHSYDGSIYTREYLYTHAGTDDPAKLREQVSSNVSWFNHYLDGLPNRDALDVGCADGAALHVLQENGWAVHGWDVVTPDYGPAPHLTITPHFSQWHFQLRFAAVLCREVIEHVEHPDLLLHALHGVTCPGGLVQVQTPKPLEAFHGVPYQMAHLVLISPPRLRTMLAGAMLDVIDSREWETGQVYLCRARR
jgi:2-polyprenyl-3-methyl-5-hydroxy-6-metoxy-1,4-benzoquinol methylase